MPHDLRNPALEIPLGIPEECALRLGHGGDLRAPRRVEQLLERLPFAAHREIQRPALVGEHRRRGHLVGAHRLQDQLVLPDQQLVARHRGTGQRDHEGNLGIPGRDGGREQTALAVPENTDPLRIDLRARPQVADRRLGIAGEVARGRRAMIPGRGADAALVVAQAGNAAPGQVLGDEAGGMIALDESRSGSVPVLRSAAGEEHHSRMRPRPLWTAEGADQGDLSIAERDLFLDEGQRAILVHTCGGTNRVAIRTSRRRAGRGAEEGECDEQKRFIHGVVLLSML